MQEEFIFPQDREIGKIEIYWNQDETSVIHFIDRQGLTIWKIGANEKGKKEVF